MCLCVRVCVCENVQAPVILCADVACLRPLCARLHLQNDSDNTENNGENHLQLNAGGVLDKGGPTT